MSDAVHAIKRRANGKRRRSAIEIENGKMSGHRILSARQKARTQDETGGRNRPDCACHMWLPSGKAMEEEEASGNFPRRYYPDRVRRVFLSRAATCEPQPSTPVSSWGIRTQRRFTSKPAPMQRKPSGKSGQSGAAHGGAAMQHALAQCLIRKTGSFAATASPGTARRQPRARGTFYPVNVRLRHSAHTRATGQPAGGPQAACRATTFQTRAHTSTFTST